jgi:hypothetical protein
MSAATARHPLDEARVGFERARLVPSLLGNEHAVPRNAVAAPKVMGKKAWIPKASFLDTGNVANVDDVARQYGELVAHGEVDALLAELAKARNRHLPAGSVRDRLTAAADLLREQGYAPDLVVCPTDWALRQELRLSLLRDNDPRIATLEEAARRWIQVRSMAYW